MARLSQEQIVQAPQVSSEQIARMSRELDYADLVVELDNLLRIVVTGNAGGPPAYTLAFECPRCGREVGATSTRCACGAAFEEDFPCPSCGVGVPTGSERCGGCGAHFV